MTRGAPARLRCEYRDDPMGIHCPRPRLSWWLNDLRPAEVQTAYQIQAASSEAALRGGCPDLWDSGRVASERTLNIEYAGPELGSGARVWWRVRCYDSDGIPSPWSEPARFEMGLLGDEARQGRWVTSPLMGSPTTAVPVPLLYRDFEVPRAPAAARLYLAVRGAARVEINACAVTGDELLAGDAPPGHDVPCRVYDVDPCLSGGRNRIAVLLADGTWCGHRAGGPRQRLGARPALWAQLVLDYPDGERQILGTDASWLWRPSWVLRADRDLGEEVDARQLPPGWSTPDVDLQGVPVLEDASGAPAPGGAPFAVQLAVCAPVEAPLRQVTPSGTRRLRFDFGRTLLGRPRLRLRGRAGTSLSVRYGNPGPRTDGQRHDAAVRWGPAVDRYTAAGRGWEVFEPQFALHAFRYLEVESALDLHDFQEVAALDVEVDAARSAAFECDHALLQRLFHAASRTLRSGLVLGPVSGLEVSHRLVDAADAEAILVGAGASLDVAALYPDGVPDLPVDEATWETMLPCLWYLYRCCGNRRLLEQAYPEVRRRLAAAPEQQWLEHGGGDEMLAAACHGYRLTLAMRMAGVLGRLGDLERLDARARQFRDDFRARYVTPRGLLVGDHQLGYLLALELGLLEGGERAAALARLESQLRGAGYHPAVDLRHGCLLLEVLTLEGRADLAYRTLLQTTAPGWLEPLQAGADVLWDTRRDQMGRLAAACVAGWLQRFLLGLELDDNLTPELNAYRRVRVQPRPPLGEAFPAGHPVGRAAGHLDTVHGRYSCEWRIDDEGFHLRVGVPGNCSARVVLPDATEILVVAGRHEFHLPSVGPEAEGRHGDDGIPLLREVSS